MIFSDVYVCLLFDSMLFINKCESYYKRRLYFWVIYLSDKQYRKVIDISVGKINHSSVGCDPYEEKKIFTRIGYTIIIFNMIHIWESVSKICSYTHNNKNSVLSNQISDHLEISVKKKSYLEIPQIFSSPQHGRWPFTIERSIYRFARSCANTPIECMPTTLTNSIVRAYCYLIVESVA